MPKPDFLIIGAQKCATSWLHRQLRSHPQVFMPADKDAALFFNSPIEIAAFEQRFITAPSDRISGDANASYFWTRNTGPYPAVFNTDISKAIQKHFGANLKLIVLLKDPIQRALSGYLHHIAHASLSSGCSVQQAPAELGIMALSRYGQHLQHWLQEYSGSQILLLPSPTQENAKFILEKVSHFLGIQIDDFNFTEAQKKVFTGLARRQLDDGIWVSFENTEMAIQAAQRDLPSMQHEGKLYTRLIDADELESIATQLEQDTGKFASLVLENDWQHSDFEKWRGWLSN